MTWLAKSVYAGKFTTAFRVVRSGGWSYGRGCSCPSVWVTGTDNWVENVGVVGLKQPGG